MHPKKKNKKADGAHEIDIPCNEQTGGLENFEDFVFRDLVNIASAKAGKSFDDFNNIRYLADLPEHI